MTVPVSGIQIVGSVKIKVGAAENPPPPPPPPRQKKNPAQATAVKKKFMQTQVAHARKMTVFQNVRNIRICMEKAIVSVAYEYERN